MRTRTFRRHGERLVLAVQEKAQWRRSLQGNLESIAERVQWYGGGNRVMTGASCNRNATAGAVPAAPIIGRGDSRCGLYSAGAASAHAFSKRTPSISYSIPQPFFEMKKRQMRAASNSLPPPSRPPFEARPGGHRGSAAARHVFSITVRPNGVGSAATRTRDIAGSSL